MTRPRCPTEPRFEGDLIGCGSEDLTWCEDEGIYDCNECGMWFDPYREPHENRTFVSRGRDSQHKVSAGTPPALSEMDRANFEQIKAACLAGRLALLSSVRRRDGAHVALVCAMNVDKSAGVFRPIPLAEMLEVNPYVIYEDPTLPDPGGSEEDDMEAKGGIKEDHGPREDAGAASEPPTRTG
jgi:hypothetical protein